MIDSLTPFYCCLVSPEGTPVMPIRWGDPDMALPQYWEIQILDEFSQPMPQPYPDPDPDDYERINPNQWIFDLLNLPPGWECVPLTQEEWYAFYARKEYHYFDRTDRMVKMRPEAEWKTKRRCGWKHDEHLEVTHWERGGKPIFKIKPTSTKTERDFPDIPFTHDRDFRRTPIPQEHTDKAVQRRERFLKGVG